MGFIIGNDRYQVTFSTLESQIEENNPVRFVDAFEENMDSKQSGFLINILRAAAVQVSGLCRVARHEQCRESRTLNAALTPALSAARCYLTFCC